ncbi:ribonuclease P protein component [Anaerosphaera aminiphila DSM 21120]|uniref:Ribonuclease P protein component n=1 Tax=Anaerosphaera aminiphila DSM 21120 TaxID=1120995 RepID=A0A1M5SCY6_9FIRM|nr:ribonuclease P protein component [Anaerosphaera aminiphila]SHH36472.1 ribonuclease P protein component [Anaerosphaera aminiphila DSM 21120]
MKDCYLKKNIEFQRVYSARNINGNKSLTVFYKKNNLNCKRVGFTITKKIGNAVTRNKIKRRLKEIYRECSGELKNGYDYVFVVKKGVDKLSFNELKNSFIHLSKRIR